MGVRLSGWSYVVRIDGLRMAIPGGPWEFPPAVPVE